MEFQILAGGMYGSHLGEIRAHGPLRNHTYGLSLALALRHNLCEARKEAFLHLPETSWKSPAWERLVVW